MHKNRNPTLEAHYHEQEFYDRLQEIFDWIKATYGKEGFVNPLDVLKFHCLYYIIFGMRSNGKTTAAMICAMLRYVMYGEPCAIVRRFDEDIKGARASMFWGSLEKLQLVKYLTGGEFDTVYYFNSVFYLAKMDEDGKRIKDSRPFCYTFALSQWQHDKGQTYPGNIGTVIFDEFMTRGTYLPDEFTLFCNTLSTILRDDGQAKIFMLGNTVSYYCPYFREMGLKHLRDMEPGDISTYTGLREDCSVCVFYSDGIPGGKETDKYFAFDNPKLRMITEGQFEMALYPHCPREFGRRDILFSFFFDFDGELMRGDVIKTDSDAGEWVFVTPKTTELQSPDTDLIYSDKTDPRPNWARNMARPRTQSERAIWFLFQTGKFFYADNQCGETLRTYLQTCGYIGR